MAQGEAATLMRRVEAARKRRDYWRGVLAEQRASGLSHSEFCRQKSISSNRYFWWKRELLGQRGGSREGGTRRKGRVAGLRPRLPSLVPVTLRAGASIPAAGVLQFFEVVLRDTWVLRVPVGFDAEELRRLVAVLEGEGC